MKLFEIVYVGDDDGFWILSGAGAVGPISDECGRPILEGREGYFGRLGGAAKGAAVDVGGRPAFTEEGESEFFGLLLSMFGQGVFALALHSFFDIACGFCVTNEKDLEKLHGVSPGLIKIGKLTICLCLL